MRGEGAASGGAARIRQHEGMLTSVGDPDQVGSGPFLSDPDPDLVKMDRIHQHWC
jgi:hypothetical protein